MPNTSYSSLIAIDEFTIQGGEDTTLKFIAYDKNGSPYALTGATCTLDLCTYGNTTVVIDTISGTVTPPNIVRYILPETLMSTLLGGKYMYQPKIITTLSKQYKPKQGTFVLVQSIG
jgi:hypothetical protein